jgi:phage baseplate assembly protein W
LLAKAYIGKLTKRELNLSRTEYTLQHIQRAERILATTEDGLRVIRNELGVRAVGLLVEHNEMSIIGIR